MTVKVHIKNFQSIKDASLEVKGLTVVTGTNGAGKTAMMRAVRGVFHNTPGNKFVRHGETQCEVELDFTDGHKVHWTKGKKPPVYNITNGAKVHEGLKPGRGVPDEVYETGVRPIRAGNKDIWPQFSPQMKGVVFLLDKSGAVLAEAVSDVKRVGQLNDSMRLAERDLRKAKDTLKVRRKDEKDLELEVEGFRGLDEIVQKVEALSQVKQDLDKTLRVLQLLFKLQKRYAEVSASIASLEAIEQVHIPEGDRGLPQVAKEIQNLESLASRHRAVTRAVQKLSPVETLTIPGGSQDVLDTLAELRVLAGLRMRLQAATSQVEALEGYAGMPDLDEGNLEKVLKVALSLQALQKRHTTCLNQVASLEGLLRENQEQIDQVQEELGGLQECPTCGSVLEIEG